MAQISTPTGGAQSLASDRSGHGHHNNDDPGASSTQAERRDGDGDDELETSKLETHQMEDEIAPDESGDAGIATEIPTTTLPSPALPTSGDPPGSPSASAIIRDSPRTTTAGPAKMFFLISLAKFAAFADVFLTGLLVPLVPTIIQEKTNVPPAQVQVWIAVFLAAAGGTAAVVSPLMPFVTRQGPLTWVILLAGLASSGASFALIQSSASLQMLIAARALQGVSSAATTGACSGMLATAVAVNERAPILSWISPAFIQSLALAGAPALSGFLYTQYKGSEIVFYVAYALIASTSLFTLIAAAVTPSVEISTPSPELVNSADEGLATESHGYGTMTPEIEPLRSALRNRRHSERSRSPLSVSSVRSSRSSTSTIVTEPSTWSLRLLVAVYGYFVLNLLTTAFATVLPLRIIRKFGWSELSVGLMFVWLSAPAVLVGVLTGAFTARVSGSARWLTAIGFLASVPGILSLVSATGQTTEDSHGIFTNPLLLTLAAISFATGLCGDPLIEEITNVVGPSSINDPSSAVAQASSLPNIAAAWGSLVGPLFAGAITWVWGFQVLVQSLALVAASTGILSVIFVQGWSGSSDTDSGRHRSQPATDEEAAPLLANDRGHHAQAQVGSSRSQKSKPFADTPGSPSNRKNRSHRRHFSVDNVSVTTTSGLGSVESAPPRHVRFQAALEDSLEGSGPSQPPTRENSGTANPERRYVMREAPHAPTTDPLLAAGSRYVIDEERSVVSGNERPKRHVVVFAEGTAPPELLARHRHHTVAINALDGTTQIVSNSTDDHAVSVTEDSGENGPEFPEATSRRYVVVVVEESEGDGEDEIENSH
ncbi:major facilitator superfamily domain-containing protein [Triangularia verruculosa]|uniref:Major facilitator superfamily domain-containing protein n=1 Tax=Triangularia verruculosa TaxID=2587418 RepID=A0AAN7AV82_9PEZI|nr:major facilitator superfamily domain-containing protein [Triangularia verruculosa]